MKIGEVARQVGLRTSAIRYYERLGLLPVPPRQSGRRHYPETVVDRLHVIGFARDAGFTLREIRQLFVQRPFSERLRKLARNKVSELDQSIARLKAMQGLLESALRCNCITAEKCGRIVTRLAAPAPNPGA